MKKSLLTLVAIASLSFLGGKVYSQEADKDFIKNNPMINYIANCVGNQNEDTDEKELAYVLYKFANNDSIFICSPTLKGKIGIKNSEIYTNSKEAENYWKENPISSSMYILKISRNGKIEKVYDFSGAGLNVYSENPEIILQGIEIK